ncbi:hypothetical protein [Gordonia rhizosphera]|nr:hypothetical protein [Gordonia rhizosphera]
MIKDHWRRILVFAGAAAFVYFVFPSVIYVLVWRTRWQPAVDTLRWFNKRSRARTLKSAGKKKRSAAAVHHVGRRSGKEYVTPVWAHRVGPSFYIGLPYGTGVDWLRNVRAAGGCDIEHDGVRYRTIDPVVVPVASVPERLGRKRKMFELMGIRSLLRVDIASSVGDVS